MLTASVYSCEQLALCMHVVCIVFIIFCTYEIAVCYAPVTGSRTSTISSTGNLMTIAGHIFSVMETQWL